MSRNSGRGRGGIIIPSEARVDDIAARQVAEQQALENHPVTKMFTALRKELFQELARVSEQNRQITARLHGLFDYMNSMGLLMWNGVNQQTGRVAVDSPMFCEQDGVKSSMFNITAPARGFDAYIEAHMDMSHTVLHLKLLQHKNTATMKEIIQMAREFNDTPGRLCKINGEQINLVDYLNANPDKLTDEEVAELAAAFGLRQEEEEHGVGEVHTTSPVTEVSKDQPEHAEAAVPVEGSVGDTEANPN